MSDSRINDTPDCLIFIGIVAICGQNNCLAVLPYQCHQFRKIAPQSWLADGDVKLGNFFQLRLAIMSDCGIYSFQSRELLIAASGLHLFHTKQAIMAAEPIIAVQIFGDMDHGDGTLIFKYCQSPNNNAERTALHSTSALYVKNQPTWHQPRQPWQEEH